jgi:hypothetical protein
MQRAKPWLIVAVLAIPVGTVYTAADAQPTATYASLAELPDFAGSWTPLGPPFVLAPARPASEPVPPPAPCAFPPAFKPEVAVRCQQAVDLRGGIPAREYCGRQFFTGRPPRGAGGAFELLFTPGRITMAVEAGLVRRIYLRDAPPANALDVSRDGASIGRWEGTTLVVETSRLDPNAPFVPGSALGPQAQVVERIALVDNDTLQIEAALTAPAVLSAPLTTRMQYRRAPDRVFTEFDTCVDDDRSLDRTSGLDRFDKTPPADLPPPPTE